MLTVGFWCAASARRNGNKLVGRRASTVQIFDRLHHLMDGRLAEYKEQDKCPN